LEPEPAALVVLSGAPSELPPLGGVDRDGAPPDGVRITLVGDSGASVEPVDVDSAAPFSVAFGFSTGGSPASVEAPAAPDLACVSVIDQSCSLGFSPSW
jgi:hypothetical protein